MADLDETATWEAGIRQFGPEDAATGGPGGLMNVAISQLANRLAYAKVRLDRVDAGDVIPAGALPAAGVGYRGKLHTVEGAAGVPDRTYICQKLGDDTYAWARIGQVYLAAAPIAGTYQKGEVILNSSPDPNEPAGWVCTTAGTPGTWQELAPISF